MNERVTDRGRVADRGGGREKEIRARQEIQLISIYESSDNHNKINNLLE